MAEYTISHYRFLNWLVSDKDDAEYWGMRFTKDLVNHGEIAVTVQELFEERESLPYHLFGDQMTKEEAETEQDDIPISSIILVPTDWAQELEKCKTDPMYFFQHYFKIDGRSPSMVEVVRAQRTLDYINNQK